MTEKTSSGNWPVGMVRSMSNALTDVRSGFASLLGDDFTIAVATPELVDDYLFEDEKSHICNAVAKRRAEFGIARVCARQALGQLGYAPCSLTPFADRSPYWPAGVKGSITHTRACCAVAVTKAAYISGIGIDVEESCPLGQSLGSKICTPRELTWLHRQPPGDQGWLAKLFFSAKEAVYKCQYPQTRTFLDFQQVDVGFDLKRKTFRLLRMELSGISLQLERFEGNFRICDHYVLTTAVLPN